MIEKSEFATLCFNDLFTDLKHCFLHLAMSVGESGGGNKDDVNLDAMTEDEQIAYAMRMSMQDEAGPSASGGTEKMDVDEQAADKEDYSEAMNDPAFLQVSEKIS